MKENEEAKRTRLGTLLNRKAKPLKSFVFELTAASHLNERTTDLRLILRTDRLLTTSRAVPNPNAPVHITFSLRSTRLLATRSNFRRTNVFARHILLLCPRFALNRLRVSATMALIERQQLKR